MKHQLTAIVIVGVLRAAPAFAQTASAPVLQVPPLRINPVTGGGSVTAQIANAQDTPLSLTLTAAPSEAVPSVGLGPSGTDLPYAVDVPAKAVVKFLIRVGGVSSDGDFSLDLSNGAAKLGTLKVSRAPVGVAVDTPPADKPVHLLDGDVTPLLVKNADPFPYDVTWRWWAGGRDLCDTPAPLHLPANGSALLECSATRPAALSILQEPFTQPVESSQVELRIRQGASPAEQTALIKAFPVNATINWFSDTWRQMWGYVGLVLVLYAGGRASLYMSQALPNRLQRLDTIEQLTALGAGTADLSDDLDSRLLVLVRLERRRLLDLLGSRDVLSPDFATTLAQCATGVTQLRGRIDALRQMDNVLARLKATLPLGVPPSLVDDIRLSLQQAGLRLAKTQPSDTDLQDALSAIAQASRQADGLTKPTAEFGQALAARVAETQALVAPTLANPAWVAMQLVLPGPWNLVRTVPAGTTSIPAAQQVDMDAAVIVVQLMERYARLKVGIANAAVAARLAAHEGELLGLLGRVSYEALQSARRLLREMAEDTYPVPDLQTAITSAVAPPAIEMQPAVAYEQAPLEFGVKLSNPCLNTGTAREAWTCHWDFGDGLQGEGWNITHYFAKAQTFTVKAHFRDENGQPVVDAALAPIVLTMTVPTRQTRQGLFAGDRKRIEQTKLNVALLVAVFGLVAGARDQIAKLDLLPGLVAVFLVGFGADTVKNLLTKK